MNVLLMGAGDIRHVLKTMAMVRRFPQPRPKFNFFVLEDTIECIARYMLLLLIFLDREYGLEVQMQHFLETYGNTFVTKRVEQYRTQLSKLFTAFFAKEEGPLAGIVDVSHLKFKQRDEIEHVVKFWRDGQFDMSAARDRRLRNYFETRYDSRKNVMDWDYQMRIKPVAPIIHTFHYKRWRETGMAYETREIEYDKPNMTLVTFRGAKHKERGDVEVRGLWGDILVSPYIAWGVETHEEDLFQVASMQQMKTAVHVAEFNVKCLLYEYHTGRKYLLPDEDNPRKTLERDSGEKVKGKSQATVEVIEEGEEDKEGEEEEKKEEKVNKNPDDLRPEDKTKFKITFLHCAVKDLYGKSKYANKFHRLYMATSHSSRIQDPELSSLLADKAWVTVESLKYLPVKEEQKAQYGSKMDQLAAAHHWQPAAKDQGNDSKLGHYSYFYDKTVTAARGGYSPLPAMKDLSLQETKKEPLGELEGEEKEDEAPPL
mmetsp:Transcript_12999/g.25173  ORF Transcript_12999/g.25173 Transcript_12999/m.25173 type:complete len:485 (+) Transcript_12999:175-1629(+)